MRLRFLLVLLALAAAYGVFHLWRFGNERSPEALLASARAEMDTLEPDFQTAMRELARALQLARERGDTSIEEQILRLRADVSRRNEAPLSALGDYRTLLERFAPDDVDLLRNAAQTAFAADELDTARELCDRLVTMQPENGGALVLRGEVEARRAELELERLGAELAAELAPEAAAQALSSAARFVYAPPRSLRRAAPFSAFFANRRPEGLAADFEVLDRISTTVSRARDDFSEGLRRSPSSYSLFHLQQLLRKATLHEEAALLGQFALGLPDFDGRQEVFCETAANLFLEDRTDLARSLWDRVFPAIGGKIHLGALPIELAFTLESMLARLGEWKVLEEEVPSFDWLAGSRGLERPNSYRDGSILIAKGEQEAGLTRLLTIQPGAPEIFEGSALRANLLLDELLPANHNQRYSVWANLGQLGEHLAPDDPLAPRIGRAWRKLAEAHHVANDSFRAEYFLGRAMSLLGEEPELVASWDQWGQETLVARNYELQQIVDSMRFDAQVFQTGTISLYDALAAAEEFYRLGELGHAGSALTFFRRTLPDHPRALLLDGRIELALGSPERAAAVWARRVEIGGPGLDVCLAELAQLPWDSIPSETRLRLLRAAPDHFGPFVRARELASSGREAEALAWFERRDPALLGDALRVEASTLYAATGQWEKARATLAQLAGGSTAAQRTAGLYLRALIHTPGGVSEADLQRVADAGPDDADLERAIDELVADDRMAEARAVLKHILRPTTLRSTALVERYLAVQLAQAGTVLEELGALRASVDDEGAGLLILAAAFEAGQPDELERAAQSLALHFATRSPYASALCAALAGDLEEAALQLESLAGASFGDDEARRSLGAALVAELSAPAGDVPATESPEPQRFVTFLTVALLGLERPGVVPWVLQRLRALPPPLRDDDRVHVLVSLCLSALGARERSEALCVQLCERGVADAWLVREELVAERLGSASPEFRALRSERLAAVGTRGLRPEHLALHQALLAEAQGSVTKALGILDLCLRLVPNAPDVLRERARLLELSGGPLAPLEDFHRLFDVLPAERASALVPSYLALLHRAEDAGQLTPGALRSYVEALSVELPGEPAAVIELAWLAAGDEKQAGLARAWELLDRFLRQTESGERRFRKEDEARWIELFLRYDPERAVRFAERELARHPESPQAWSAWTRALHAAGHFEQAYAEHALFARFHPEPETLQWVPRYACDAGVAPDTLALLVRQTQQGLALAGEAAEARDPGFVLALAAFDRSFPLGAEALVLLAGAWRDERLAADPRERRRVTVAYALALAQNGSPEGRAAGRAALEAWRAECKEELERHLADTLLALAPY